MCLKNGSDVHYSRKAVITRLASIDIIVWMDIESIFLSKLASQNLNGSIGNNLVCIHIGLGS